MNNGNSLLAPKTIFNIIVYQNGKQRITHYRVYVFHNAMPLVYNELLSSINNHHLISIFVEAVFGDEEKHLFKARLLSLVIHVF